MKSHSIIPIFLPELACPHQCVFCNQKNITATEKLPSEKEVSEIIESHLKTIKAENRTCEIAFFGGSFTGLPLHEQEKYLKLAAPYVENAEIEGIRISTRPDYINDEILSLLKQYHVKIIEIGAQSMDEDVLRLSGRGHSAEDVRNAAKLIKEGGFILGIQMMVGLPGDTPEKTYTTAKEIINLGADGTRIYPVLVIDDTELAEMYKAGDYEPLSIEEAVLQTAPIYRLFEENGVMIYKCGLHPSEFLYNGKLMAGPWHPAFRQLVQSKNFLDKAEKLLEDDPEIKGFEVNPSDINAALGFEKGNLKVFQMKNTEFRILQNANVKKGEIHALHT
ncbi:MAG: radical SAM protein [Marinilabiliales bacterium]|nr:MAG: radical SAM protein [Marinilabiliales bacterium]